ncbi:acylphosphatase [Candidatus Woesearchaeota archaeon]|jgi:acylphosphatase|nr:acylphosphatase [Candidatus Woesearchaeota archaeon]|tara:strand:+ start:210 stop:479 length:270 start_codon:yes stop_codon:yes gene_type:complete
MKRLRIIIHGKVQGVLFRIYTVNQARRIGVRGFVRNLSDGLVEAVAEGEENKLKEFISACEKGSVFSKVTNIELEWLDYNAEFEDFNIR